MEGISLGCKGTQQEREKFIFDLYDLDNTGIIKREEIITILHNIKPTFSTAHKDKIHISAKAQAYDHAKSVDSSPNSPEDDKIHLESEPT